MGYKRYGNSESVPTFNDDNNGEAVSNGILKNSSKKEIYFGIKKPKSAADSDKPWRELTTDDFYTQIKSDTDECSATITKNDNDTTNKTGIIRYILSKNTTGSARLITFNYKATTLFTITQDAGPVDNTYVYLRYWVFDKSTYENIITSANNTTHQYRFSLGIDSGEDTDAYISHETWSSSGNIIYHVTNNKDLTNIFSTATSIKKLVDNGTLTYVEGKNFNNNTISSIIKFPTKMYENINTLVPVNDNSIVYLYSGSFEATVNANDYYLSTDNLHGIINWGNINNNDDVTSIGKYKLNSTIKYIVIWDLQNGNINGNTSSIQDIVNSGDTVSFSKYTPVKTGYTFNGWATSNNATSGNTTGNSAPITQHTTFYATWKQLSKTVTFRFGNPITNNNIIITWDDSSLPDVEFTIKIKDITNNSTFDITIPRNYQSSDYTTNKTFISGHQYQLVSCSPTKVGNTTYQVFTGVTIPQQKYL